MVSRHPLGHSGGAVPESHRSSLFVDSSKNPLKAIKSDKASMESTTNTQFVVTGAESNPCLLGCQSPPFGVCYWEPQGGNQTYRKRQVQRLGIPATCCDATSNKNGRINHGQHHGFEE